MNKKELDSDNVSFNTRINEANIEQRISQLIKLRDTLRYKAKLDEYERQEARRKELIRSRKEFWYNWESRQRIPPIDMGDGTVKIVRRRSLPKEIEEDDTYLDKFKH
jgi:hypothetical protein